MAPPCIFSYLRCLPPGLLLLLIPKHSFLGWPCLLTSFTLLPTKNISLPSSTKDTHTSLPFMPFLLPKWASLPVYPAHCYTDFKSHLKGQLQAESLSSLLQAEGIAPHSTLPEAEQRAAKAECLDGMYRGVGGHDYRFIRRTRGLF